MGLPSLLSERVRASLIAEEARVIDSIGGGKALPAILDDLLRTVEAQFEGDMVTSILLLDPQGGRLWHCAAPSLPPAYCAAIDGLVIGPQVGSCGTAAYLGHPVYVTDISRNPLWAPFRDIAAAYGLRACWSTPIEGDEGRVLGTFAIYYRTPRSPTLDELEAIKHIIRSAGMAIEHHRA